MKVLLTTIYIFFVLNRAFSSSFSGGSHDENFQWNKIATDSLVQVLSERFSYHKVAKNVLIFVGDGMGVSTVTAARILKGQRKGLSGEEESLTFDAFPHIGLVKTYTTDFQVPDSAGTATALLCGVKTKLGYIGVNEFANASTCRDLKAHSVDSIIRRSIRYGKRTGIVTTTEITHATPAAGFAHTADRHWKANADIPTELQTECEDIASQLVTKNHDINVFLGGGRRFFHTNDTHDPESDNVGERTDGRDLISEWRAIMNNSNRDHRYVWNSETFNGVDPKDVDYLLGLFEPGHLQYEGLRNSTGNGDPTLTQLVEKSIQILQKGKRGFTLLVEAGRIDHGHHEEKATLALEETLEFDRAIEKALSMVDLSDTLVVVTADHSHVFTMGGLPSRGNPILGLVDETGFELEPSMDGLPYLTLAYSNGPGPTQRTNLTGVDTESVDFVRPTHVPLYRETHGGEDLAVYAIGPGSFLFNGVQEQNYIAHAISYASCIDHIHMDSHCYGVR